MKPLLISGIVCTALLSGTGTQAAWFVGSVLKISEPLQSQCLEQARVAPHQVVCKTSTGNLINVTVQEIHSTTPGHTMRVVQQVYL